MCMSLSDISVTIVILLNVITIAIAVVWLS